MGADRALITAAPGLRPAANRRATAGVALLLATLAFVLALSDWTWRADRLVYDFGLTVWQRPVPADPVIVAIDDASIAAIGRWPWPRAVHATLLERLAAARPRAIGVDVIFSEPDPDPHQDALLGQALARAAPVVLSVAWQRPATGEPPQMLRPVTDPASGVTLGHAEATVDADGVMRHVFLEAGWGDERVPHLALALLRAGGEAPAPGLPLADDPAAQDGAAAWQRRGRFLLRYAGPPGQLQRVSYADVLRGTVPAERLAGRYLLVGMTATGLGDTAATPVNRQQHAMPGVELLGHALYTLRSGDTLRPAPPLAGAGLSALLVLALVAGIQWLGPRRALALALLCVPVVLGASLLALRAGWWWSPVPWALAAVLAYPLWSWRQLEHAVDALDAEIRLLQSEGGLGPTDLRPVAGQRMSSIGSDAGTSTGTLTASSSTARRDPLHSRLETLHVATETVRSARRFLADALAGLPIAMAVTDAQGRVLLANLHMAQLFEAEDAEQMQGLDLPGLLVEFVPAQPLDWAALFAADPSRAAPQVVEARLARQGDFLLHFAPVQLLEQQRWVVTWADISAIRQAQRRRDRALAFVSHDLRGPAQALVLLANLHRDGRLQMPQDELLAEVQRQAGRTLQLAEGFVRVADVESRPLQLQSVDLGNLLSEVAADFHPQALDAGLTIEVQPCGQADRPDGAWHWPLDMALLRRGLGNLVSNALHHGPPGSTVTLAAEPMPETDMLCLSVTDQGPGLTAAQRQRLNQGDEGLPAGDTRGVGLGLQFVQRVASRHGGQLQVLPGPDGIGCRFELRLGRGTQAGGVGAGWIGTPTEPEGGEVS